jgi:hypothetical protein
MPKRKKSGKAKANNRSLERSVRKSLPLLEFEEFAKEVLRERFSKLPYAFTADDLAKEVQTYLDYSVKKIQLGGKVPMKVYAMDIERYYDPQRHIDLFEQPDFRQWAEPLLTDANLSALGETMQKMRERAGQLGIDWSLAAPIVGKVADRYRPDQRPATVQRGEFCEQVIEELRRIREREREFGTFEDLERICPDYGVVRILKHSPFDSEDRVLLASPNRWERVVTYASGILEKYYRKSPHTIRQDRKRFKSSIRTSRTYNNRNR